MDGRGGVIRSIRGVNPEKLPKLSDFNVRPSTLCVYMALIADKWPSNTSCTDFGLTSERHYEALQHALRDGVTPKQLDEAVGDGGKLTALIGPGGPYRDVIFRTVWDEIPTSVAGNGPNHTVEAKLGVCPLCYRNDGFRCVGGEHWVVCDSHRCKWLVAESWFDPESEAEREACETTRKSLCDYIEIEPLYAPSLR